MLVLPTEPADQLRAVREWAARKQDGFWDLAIEVFSFEVETSAEVQRVFLAALQEELEMLGWRLTDLLRVLTSYVKKAPHECLVDTARVFARFTQLISYGWGTGGYRALYSMFERKDLSPELTEALLLVLGGCIGPPFVEVSREDEVFGLVPPDVVTASSRRVSLGATRLKTLHGFMEKLRQRDVDVSSLEARVPSMKSNAPLDIATVVSILEEKGGRFELELPSGKLGLFSGINSDAVVEKRFARAGVLQGARLGRKTLLWLCAAVKWSKPHVHTVTGLYAGDSKWLRSVCEVSRGRLSDVLTLPTRKVGEVVRFSDDAPAGLVVTWQQADVSWSFGADDTGAVVAMLLSGGR